MSRPAPYGNVLALADQALSAENGLVVKCDTYRHAINLRMNFYKKRSEMRDWGVEKYDDLILTIEGLHSVVFRKKDAVVAVTPL